jgi:hypothetical protein
MAATRREAPNFLPVALRSDLAALSRAGASTRVARASAGSEERVSTEPVGRSFAHTRVNGREPVVIAIEPNEPNADESLDFVRFCYGRRRVAWPALYDEMAAVAARGAYRGLGFAELAERGVCFSLPDLPRLAALTEQVMLEERSSPEPLSVRHDEQPTPALVMAPARS